MSNALQMELKGKTVLLRADRFKEGTDLRFVCEDGFGCSPSTNGTSIYGHWVSDKQDDKINGYDVESLATDDTTESTDK